MHTNFPYRFCSFQMSRTIQWLLVHALCQSMLQIHDILIFGNTWFVPNFQQASSTSSSATADRYIAHSYLESFHARRASVRITLQELLMDSLYEVWGEQVVRVILMIWAENPELNDIDKLFHLVFWFVRIHVKTTRRTHHIVILKGITSRVLWHLWVTYQRILMIQTGSLRTKKLHPQSYL